LTLFKQANAGLIKCIFHLEKWQLFQKKEVKEGW
jgi:hypothetical protein